ncbi:MAG TPA: hypothetical protein V6D00_14595 [Pantanalinema sp.]
MSGPKNPSPPKPGKGFKLTLPKFKPPALPAVKLPAPPSHFDGTFLLAMVLVGGLSAGSAAIAVRFAMPSQVVIQRPSDADQEHGRSYNPAGFPDITTGPNVTSDYSLTMERPVIAETAYVHPQASVIGYVTLGERVLVAPQASIRGDEGKNIQVGDESNVQDGAVIHALPTEVKGVSKMEHRVVVNGQEYAVYVGDRVTLAPQSQVHGPSVVGDDAYIGMQALVFKARIGAGCVLEPRAGAIGVNIREGHYVPAGVVVTSQEQADALPAITPGYAYHDAGAQAVKVNTQLAEGYRNLYPGGYKPQGALSEGP